MTQAVKYEKQFQIILDDKLRTWHQQGGDILGYREKVQKVGRILNRVTTGVRSWFFQRAELWEMEANPPGLDDDGKTVAESEKEIIDQDQKKILKEIHAVK
jgi:hypothetical protein